MVKFFGFIVLISISTIFCSFGQKTTSDTILYGFEGSKPLKEDELIIFKFSDMGDWFAEPAYKGETKYSFLKRVKMGDYNKSPVHSILKNEKIKKNFDEKKEDTLIRKIIGTSVIFLFLIHFVFFRIK